MRRTRRGETIIEVLVAMFVLVMTSTAATFLIAQSGRTSYDIKQRFQARYLAREAFENVKMIRDTNWIRFQDRSCWDVSFDAHECSVTNAERIIASNASSTKDFALVTSKPEDLYMHLVPVSSQGGDAFDACMKFDGLNKSLYSVYRDTSADPDHNPYEGLLYSTDGTPPADAQPVYCRRVRLTRINKNDIQVDAAIGWKVGSELKQTTSGTHIRNDAQS